MQQGKQRPSRESRRAGIIDSAADVFGRLGFRQGSLKDVAAASGLTVQGVLHYFGSKEEVLMAALERRQEERSEVTDNIRDTEGVIAFMRHALAENLRQGGFMRLFVTLAAEATDPEHPAHAHFVGRYANTFSEVRQAYMDDVAAGRAAADLDPGRAAEAIIAICDGLQLQKLLRPELDLLAAYDDATRPYAAPGSVRPPTRGARYLPITR